MKDKDLKLEEVEDYHTLDGAGEGGVEGEEPSLSQTKGFLFSSGLSSGAATIWKRNLFCVIFS